jgi:hypothetical protein
MPGQHWDERDARGRRAFLLVLAGVDSREAFRIAKDEELTGERLRQEIASKLEPRKGSTDGKGEGVEAARGATVDGGFAQLVAATGCAQPVAKKVQPVANSGALNLISCKTLFERHYSSSIIYSSRGAAAADPIPGEIQLNEGDVLAMIDGSEGYEGCCMCPEPATVICFGCERPLCDRHTILVSVGREDDRLDVAVCAECAPEARGLMIGEEGK